MMSLAWQCLHSGLSFRNNKRAERHLASYPRWADDGLLSIRLSFAGWACLIWLGACRLDFGLCILQTPLAAALALQPAWLQSVVGIDGIRIAHKESPLRGQRA